MAGMIPPTPRFMGLPINLIWQGWRSNTLELQRSGWEVSVSEDPCNRKMQIALHHRAMRMYGISPSFDFEYHVMGIDRENFLRHIEVPIVQVAPQIEVVRVTAQQLGRYAFTEEFKPVDACPSVVTQEIKRLQDMVHFQPIPQTQEIIVPEKSVSDLLQEILKKQIPEQERYRQRVREEAMLARNRLQELPSEKKVHAQIITLKQVA